MLLRLQLPRVIAAAPRRLYHIDALARDTLAVLNEPEPLQKALKTRAAAAAWDAAEQPELDGELSVSPSDIPSSPARPAKPELLSTVVPNHKQLGVGLNVHMLHTLAHIELQAMDMYVETVLRAVTCAAWRERLERCAGGGLRRFVGDFMRVADDEARHFGMVDERLRQLGSSYGALPAHKLLWEQAVLTQDDVAARIALVPLVQEARGLDAGPRLVQRLRGADPQSAAVIAQIVEEEVAHVRAGVTWFERLSDSEDSAPAELFQRLIHDYMPTGLIPPFQQLARLQAGMPASWYEPMSRDARRGVLVAANWPSAEQSAAGARSLGIMQALHEHAGVHWAVVSPCRFTEFGERVASLEHVTGPVRQVEPNVADGDSMETVLRNWNPDLVVFDRFYMHEMFGDRVRETAPNAVRVVDTQDLHFLRVERGEALQEDAALEDVPSIEEILGHARESSRVFEREMTALRESDAVVVTSPVERGLLVDELALPAAAVHVASFLYEEPGEEEQMRERGKREGFAFIGNFRHAPNVDCVQYLRRVIWPRLRERLPGASLHVYGSFAQQRHMDWHHAEHGFLVHGQCRDQFETLGKHVALLAPVRFGAGAKGKVTDAWRTGTPVVGSELALEGMHAPQWSLARTTDEFVDKAVRLYEDDALWAEQHKLGMAALQARHTATVNGPPLGAWVGGLLHKAREAQRGEGHSPFVQKE